MSSEQKPVRKVRFNLPEPKKSQVTTKEGKSHQSKSHATNGSKSKTAATQSVIVNKNAKQSLASSRRLSMDGSIRTLPQIHNNKKDDIQSRSISSTSKRLPVASKQQRPKSTTIKRSQSFTIKKAGNEPSETYVNKRFSDSFLYTNSKRSIATPTLKVTESLERGFPNIHVTTEKDLNPNFLQIPILEDDNANYLPQPNKTNVSANEMSVMRGKQII